MGLQWSVGGGPPPSWLDDEVMQSDVVLHTTVIRALFLHGAMVLAVKHPDIPPVASEVLLEMLDHLESMFEEVGLERPPAGWRGDAGPEDEGVDDAWPEGD